MPTVKDICLHLLKKHFPDICLTVMAAAVFACLILAFICTMPRALDGYEARSRARQAATNDIYNGQ